MSAAKTKHELVSDNVEFTVQFPLCLHKYDTCTEPSVIQEEGGVKKKSDCINLHLNCFSTKTDSDS